MEYAYLERVKAMLGITGTYQDETLKGYVQEVMEFMIDSGVLKSVAESEKAVGVITRGISDLWNYGSGGTSLSPYFKQRVIQLSYATGEESPEDPDDPEVIPISKKEIIEVYKN